MSDYRYPNNQREVEALIAKHKDVVNQRRFLMGVRNRSSGGHYEQRFVCPGGHRHRDMLTAVICEDKRLLREGS